LKFFFVGLVCLSSVGGLQHGVGQNQNSRKKQLHEGGTSHSSHSRHNKAALPPGSRLQQPFFDTLIDPDTGQGGRNVTTAEGGKALLFCTIRSLGDNNTVSWIKKARHPVVLSSGTAVFTSDRRVRIKSRSDTWILQIDPVLQKDDAFYECQVNTRNTMSLVFKINVDRSLSMNLGMSRLYINFEVLLRWSRLFIFCWGFATWCRPKPKQSKETTS
jgi:hypothetical protein